MDLQNHSLRGQHINTFAFALVAMLCIASANSLAADAGLKLKLDLGLTMGEEECVEEAPDAVQMPSSGSSIAGPMLALASASSGDGLSARPGFVESMFASTKPVSRMSSSADTTPPPVPQAAAGSGTDKPAEPVVTASVAAAPVATAVAATPAPLAMTDAPAASPWFIAPADKTLNTALARWAAAAGWQLLWELPVDYAVDVRTEIRGSFIDAIGLVARSMETAEIPMKAIFYEGNRVLRIVAKGSE